MTRQTVISKNLDIIVVTPEPCWPAINGGRTRTGAIALELAQEFRVGVAAPGSIDNAAACTAPLPSFDLPCARVPRISDRLAIHPRLGRVFLGRAGIDALTSLVRRYEPEAILYSHSYLAAMNPFVDGTKIIVDFPNVETRRLMSLATSGRLRNRLSSIAEGVKAHVWEPRVARGADLSIAVNRPDARCLAGWGCDPVIVANVAHQMPDPGFSPADGPAVFIASFGYGPNAEAAEAVLKNVWPRLSRALPNARLVLAGHESRTRFGWASSIPGVTVAGELAAIEPLLAEAAVVLAPVGRGGGTQLKVVHGLAARRVVVAMPYSARSIPSDFVDGCVVRSDWSGFADAVANLITDVESRHRRETALRRACLSSWSDVTAPLLTKIHTLLTIK
jgi:hypothetical protein